MPEIDPVLIIALLATLLPIGFAAYAFRSMREATEKIKNGIPGTATVESIAETGTTISTPSIGPDAPVYKFELLVLPSTGGAPRRMIDEQAVPRIAVPFVVPGIELPVDIDRSRPDHVKINWQRFGQGGDAVAPAAAAAAGAPVAGGVMLPSGAVVSDSDVVTAVRGGTMPVEVGSAAQLLATGVRGTAVVTTAMPLGMTAGEMNPKADPAIADQPMWLFHVQVELPGKPPFPAVFGHRVPLDRVAEIGPGVRLSIANDPANPSQDVAIDWTAPPVHAIV